MDKTSHANTDHQLKAVSYELLALSFRYPESELVEALASGEYQESLGEIAQALQLALPQDTTAKLDAYRGKDPDGLLHTLRQEATRLFVGAPDPVVAPYEGMWRAADDGVQPLLFVNPHSMAVERFYRTYGIAQPEGKNEPLDHVSAELEFMQYVSMLAAGLIEPSGGVKPPPEGWPSVHDSFVDEHIKVWLPRFAAATREAAREPFYIAAAQLLMLLTGFDRHQR